jgi:cytochrome-b5 reductase
MYSMVESSINFNPIHFSKRASSRKFDPKMIETTPSAFVADKKISAFEKYGGVVELTLAEKISVTHDTYIFRFALPESNLVMGTNVSNHIRFSCTVPTQEFPQGMLLRKYYTPTSKVDQEGYVDLPIKIYRANEHPNFSFGGSMTTYLEEMKIGETLIADGPYKRIEYYGNGYFKVGGNLAKKKSVAFVAGGTGITVFYPIIRAACESGDPTRFTLIYSNKTEDDYIFKDELEYLGAMYSENFKYYPMITNPKYPQNSSYLTGFINYDLLKKLLPVPSNDALIINMGPKGMNDAFANIIMKLNKYDPATMIISKAVNRLVQDS